MFYAHMLLQPIIFLRLNIRHFRQGRLEFRAITPACADDEIIFGQQSRKLFGQGQCDELIDGHALLACDLACFLVQ